MACLAVHSYSIVEHANFDSAIADGPAAATVVYIVAVVPVAGGV